MSKTKGAVERALVPLPLRDASPDRADCVACRLFRRCETPFMRPYIPPGWTKRLLVVGEAPGEHEDEVTHRPFTGPAGKLLDKLLRKAGYSYEDVAYVNAVRCRPKRNAAPTMKQVRACRPFLIRTLQHLQPQVVIALGATAIRGLTNDGRQANVTKARGKRLVVPGIELPSTVVFATYHPSAVLRGGTHYRPLIIKDLKRAQWEELPYPTESKAFPVYPVLGVDTEYAKDGGLLTVGLASPTEARANEAILDPKFKALRYPLGKAEVITGHSLSGDIDQLVRLGLAKPEWVSGEKTVDSLLVARMVDENRGKGAYGLEQLLTSEYNVQPWKGPTEKIGIYAEDWPEDLRKERCRLDAWAACKVVTAFLPKLAKLPGKLVEFTHRVAMSLHRMELAGVYIDLAHLEQLGGELHDEMQAEKDKLKRDAHLAGMTEFEPTNDGHLRELLYQRLKLPVTRRTRKSREPAVDKVTLKQFADNPTVQKLLAFNAAEKLYSTNILGLKALVQPAGEIAGVPAGWLPVHINPLGARTGRRASERPNMQNWKKRMRRLVRSRYAGGLILECDYSRLEVVLLAWLAKDDKLLDYFLNGDGYIGVGREVFKREVTKGTDEYRTIKSIVLGTNYNMQDFKLAETLWYVIGIKLSSDWDEHVRRAGRLRQKYLKAFPGVPRYMEAREKELLRTHKVVTASGRERHLLCPEGRDTEGFGHLLNQAINYPVQGLAADVTGSALVDVEHELCRAEGLSLTEYHELLLDGDFESHPMSVLINEVHDALIGDLHPDKAKRDTELFIETMRAIPTFRSLVPGFDIRLNLEHTVGPYWGGEDGV